MTAKKPPAEKIDLTALTDLSASVQEKLAALSKANDSLVYLHGDSVKTSPVYPLFVKAYNEFHAFRLELDAGVQSLAEPAKDETDKESSSAPKG